jgi:hypothetical protein
MQLYHYPPGSGLSIKQYYELEDTLWRSRTIDNSAEELVAVLYDFYHDLKTSKHHLFKDVERVPDVKICRIYDYEPGTGRAETQFYKYVKAIGHGTSLRKDQIITMILSKVFDDIE